MRDAWVVGLGLIPLGMAFGLLMTQAGFGWWWTSIFSIVIFAGSMEFLAIDMVLAGVGPISSALTAFMVNFRHIFYGLTFPRHVVRGRLPKLYATYALTALFAVLAFEAFQASKDLSAPLIAAALALVAALIAPGQMLMVGLIAYFGVLLMRFVSPALDTALTWKRRRQ